MSQGKIIIQSNSEVKKSNLANLKTGLAQKHCSSVVALVLLSRWLGLYCRDPEHYDEGQVPQTAHQMLLFSNF